MRASAPAAGSSRAALFAAAAPLLCAVHCAAAPLVALALPSLGVHGPLEGAFKLASGLIAVLFVAGGVRAHGRRVVALPVAAGLALWVAGGLAGTLAAETVASVAGGLLLAAGLWWNASLRHRAACHHCGCPAHGAEG